MLPRAVWAALAGGLAFRVVKAFIDPGLLVEPPAGEFHLIAKAFLSSGVFSYDGLAPTAFRLPLWPLTMALLFKLTGTTAYLAVVAMNFVFSGLAAVLTYRAARRVLPEGWAVAAVWLQVLNPFSAHVDYSANYEPLLTLLFAATMYLLVRGVADGGDSPRTWLAAGAVTGLSLTCRSSMLLLPPIVTAFLPSWTGRPGAWRHGVLMSLLAYAFVTPWLVRNYWHFKRVIPFEDGMGLHALYQSSTGVQGIMPDDRLPEPIKTYYFNHDPRIGPASKVIALQNIRENPLRYLGYCVGRIRTIWFDGGWAEQGLGSIRSFDEYRREGSWGRAASKVLAKGAEAAFLTAALVGMALSWKTKAARPVTLLILYMNIHLLTQGLSRYVVPAVPGLAVLACLGLSGALERVRARVA